MNSPQLDLFGYEAPAVPWNGQSPRALTKSARRFSFTARAGARVVMGDPSQLELFARDNALERKCAESASTLIPLPRRW